MLSVDEHEMSSLQVMTRRLGLLVSALYKLDRVEGVERSAEKKIIRKHWRVVVEMVKNHMQGPPDEVPNPEDDDIFGDCDYCDMSSGYADQKVNTAAHERVYKAACRYTKQDHPMDMAPFMIEQLLVAQGYLPDEKEAAAAAAAAKQAEKDAAAASRKRERESKEEEEEEEEEESTLAEHYSNLTTALNKLTLRCIGKERKGLKAEIRELWVELVLAVEEHIDDYDAHQNLLDDCDTRAGPCEYHDEESDAEDAEAHRRILRAAANFADMIPPTDEEEELLLVAQRYTVDYVKLAHIVADQSDIDFRIRNILHKFPAYDEYDSRDAQKSFWQTYVIGYLVTSADKTAAWAKFEQMTFREEKK